MRPSIDLRHFSTPQLIEELARRANAKPTRRPERWCEDCAHFVAWVDQAQAENMDCPDDYNPCQKGHAMSFLAPEQIDDAYGFYRTVCADRVIREDPDQTEPEGHEED